MSTNIALVKGNHQQILKVRRIHIYLIMAYHFTTLTLVSLLHLYSASALESQPLEKGKESGIGFFDLSYALASDPGTFRPSTQSDPEAVKGEID